MIVHDIRWVIAVFLALVSVGMVMVVWDDVESLLSGYDRSEGFCWNSACLVVFAVLTWVVWP